MTMHLVRGMTSLSTRKRATKIDMVAMEAEFRAYNKEMRRANMPSLQFATLDSYIDYRLGRGKKAVSTNKPLSLQKTEQNPERSTKHIPSLGTTGGVATKKDPHKYSGEYLVGIATMHKSNLVPVGKDDTPSNYSTMRRN